MGGAWTHMQGCTIKGKESTVLPYWNVPTEAEVLKKKTICGKDCAFLALDAIQADDDQERVELGDEAEQIFDIVFPLHGPNFCTIARDISVRMKCSQVARYYYQNKEVILEALDDERSRWHRTNSTSATLHLLLAS
jgi:hypothetical protein